MLSAAFLITAGLAAQAASAPAVSTLLAEAEKRFQAGVQARDHPEQAHKDFAAALAHYETIRKQGARNAALCRNQGNAALLAGDLPAAILVYRRGLRLDPGSGFLQESLEYARDQVEYPRSGLRPPAPDWPSWLPRPSDHLLLALAVGLYTLGCIAWTRWLMIRRLSLLWGGAVVLLVAIGLGCIGEMSQQENRQERAHPLIVVKQITPLRTGNGVSYPPVQGLPTVYRGMEGHLQFARGAWLQVEFPSGALGWLQRGHVLRDTP